MFGGIYAIKNLITEKYYIGSAININKRWIWHRKDLKANKHRNGRLQNSYNKHGKVNFYYFVIEIVEDKNKLLEREQYWIDKYKSYSDKFGYNICEIAGSPLGMKHSEKTKQKLREINLGKKVSVETLEKFKNRIISLETRIKMSEARKGIIQSIETKLKRSISLKGRIFTEEHKRKLSIANLGKTQSKEQIEKAVAARKKNSTWKHAEGRECKCNECMERKRILKRNWKLSKSS